MTKNGEKSPKYCLKKGVLYNVKTGAPPPPATRIPQVNTDGMSDAEKAKIPMINRLHSAPTAAEAEFFTLLSKEPVAMDDPKYAAACKAMEDERGQ